ncbi:MAG: P-II family nitrogen regulator [Longimicrobiaceae bacterium]
MKMVLAFVQPFKLDAVTQNLGELPHFPGMTVGAVRGFGHEHAELPPQTVEEKIEDFTDKVQVETIVHDEQVDSVIGAIARAAHTGRYGDGMIFVLPVERSVRIATLREGEEAV